MKRSTLIAMLVACVAAAGPLSCDSEDESTYDVPISWTVAGGKTCGAVLGPDVTPVVFDKVVVTLYAAEGDEEPIQDPVEVPCDDFSYTIPRLEKGSYFLTLGAMAEYDGDYLPYYQAKGEIEAPAEDDEGYEFMLVQGTGEVLVSWSFDNNKMCGPNGVEIIETSLTDELVSCDDGELLVTDLDWPAEYSLTVEGFDENDDVTWSGEYEGNPFEVKPGQRLDIHVVLSPI